MTLTASGAASYLWSPGGETTAAITVNAAGTYSVVGTDANGCKNSASQSVTVNPLPTVAITADGPTALCQGATVTLTASGAASYLWSPGRGDDRGDHGQCGWDLQRGGDRRQRVQE